MKKTFKKVSRLPNSSVTLIDVGAAGGIEKRWHAVTEDLVYYGFEPDERSRKNLSSQKIRDQLRFFPSPLVLRKRNINLFM